MRHQIEWVPSPDELPEMVEGSQFAKDFIPLNRPRHINEPERLDVLDQWVADKPGVVAFGEFAGRDCDERLPFGQNQTVFVRVAERTNMPIGLRNESLFQSFCSLTPITFGEMLRIERIEDGVQQPSAIVAATIADPKPYPVARFEVQRIDRGEFIDDDEPEGDAA